MEFRGKVQQRKQSVRYAFAVLAVVLLILEIVHKQWFYVILAVLVILACFYEREPVVNEKGVDFSSKVFTLEMHDLWPWEAVTAIEADYKKKAPDVLIRFGKEVTIREITFDAADVNGVMELAKKMNPNIIIG